MDKETVTIYVWPDGSWISSEDPEADDMDWYTMTTGKSDDYASYEVSLDLEPEDIEELISMNALPGMLPDLITANIEEMGKVKIPEGCILIVSHSNDIDYNAVTMLEDKLIVNAPDLFIEVITPKEKKDA